MAKDSDVSLAVLALLATALVLVAPVLGRAGFPFAADVVMAAAAASGVGAFLLAAAQSFLGPPFEGRPRKLRSPDKPQC
jgi:hypothetical protein